jgi:hypothetical protein
MDGVRTGRGHRLSDQEKKARGTFRADMSEEVYAARAAEKIITGPWLKEIPEPILPLGEVGRKKYDEFTRQLFDQNKLTQVTQVQAEVAAAQFDKIFAIRSAGKQPSASDVTQLQRALDSLKIAEDAPKIANPGKQNKFAGAGFANRAAPAFRIRRAAGPHT